MLLDALPRVVVHGSWCAGYIEANELAKANTKGGVKVAQLWRPRRNVKVRCLCAEQVRLVVGAVDASWNELWCTRARRMVAVIIVIT